MTWFWTESTECWILLCPVIHLNTCYSSQGNEPHGAPVLDEKDRGHICIFPLYLHESRAVASLGCVCDGAEQQTPYPQSSHLIIRERADPPCVT